MKFDLLERIIIYFSKSLFEYNEYTTMSLKAVEKTLFDNNCQGIGNYNVNN